MAVGQLCKGDRMETVLGTGLAVARYHVRQGYGHRVVQVRPMGVLDSLEVIILTPMP